jgi:hypothetical protein
MRVGTHTLQVSIKRDLSPRMPSLIDRVLRNSSWREVQSKRKLNRQTSNCDDALSPPTRHLACSSMSDSNLSSTNTHLDHLDYIDDDVFDCESATVAGRVCPCDIRKVCSLALSHFNVSNDHLIMHIE